MGKDKAQMSLKTPKGTQDWEGKDMVIRDRIFSTIAAVFKRHGGVTIDTPVFELREILAGKYGEDSKLIYDLQDQGGELCSLRYDLTVPFARWLAMNPQIQNIKRYHIAKVYRRDQPAMTKGRKREFYQCDFDIAGSYDPMLPDAEILRITCEIFQELGWDGKFSIKINHRGILDGVFAVCGVPAEKIRAISSAVDKLDKSPWEEVRKEMLEEKGLSEEVADKIWEYVQNKGGVEILEKLQKDGSLKDNQSMQKGLSDMEILFRYLAAFKVLPFIEFNLSLARGLDYYTGVIYEVVTEGSAPSSSGTAKALQRSAKKAANSSKPPASNNPDDEDRSSDPSVGVGSIAAGGRYDNLIEKFNPRALVPCVGISFGVDRIFSVTKARMDASGGTEKVRLNEVDVFVMAFGGKGFEGMLEERMNIARTLWEAGIKAEFSYKVKPKSRAQFKAAEVGGVPFAVIIAEDEQREGKVKIKELGLPEGHLEKEGVLIKLDDLVQEMKTRLWKKAREEGIDSVGSITAEANGLKIGIQDSTMEMDQLIKIDLNGPKLLTITHKAVQNGLPIPSFPLTLTIKRIKIGLNSIPMLKVDSDSLPLYMNPIGPGSEFEILDPEGHSLYTWRLQDDGRSSQPEPQVTSTPDEPIENRSNAQVHAADSASGADEPQPTSTPSKPARSRKSPRLLEKEKTKERPSLLKEERELLFFVLSKLYAQMCNIFRLLFWEPVDPEEMDLPTYTRIITQPMALRDMKDKLKEQHYSSTQDFRGDFELMVRNAELFNGRNHPVTLMSRRVEEAFRSLMDGGSQCPKLKCGERECRDCRKSGKENKAGRGEKRRAAAEPSRSDRAAKRKAFRMESEKQDTQLEEVGL